MDRPARGIARGAARRGLGAALVATLAFAALGLSACGSSSGGQAKSLLQQTFGGSHKVNSGNLSFSLTISPSGSKTLTGPLSLSFGGPFQSLGTGKLPASNFTVSLSGLGKTGSLSLLSTGQNGYVTVGGASYQMPPATYQKIESSFAGLTSSGSGASGSGTLAKLGINPLRWLVNPSVAGNETIAGADTTHIKAGINVAALLGDLDTFLHKASAVGVPSAGSVQNGISPATRTKIASEVQNPRFDVWTGSSDKTPRKLAIQLTLPVTGQISTLLGGLQSAQVSLSIQYANLNQPQTITAPTNLRPFSEFATKLRTLEQALQGAIGGSLGLSGGAGGAGAGGAGAGGAGAGGAGATGTTGTGSPGGSSSSNGVSAYGQCVQAAGSDVSKLQQCASLLSK